MFMLAAVLPLFPVAREIQFDWPLLTDFTTEYSFNDKYLAQNSGRLFPPTESQEHIPEEKEHGVIQFDLNTERLQIKADGEIQVPQDANCPLNKLGITSIQGHGEVRFNGKSGFASTRGKYTANGFALEFCIKANVPQGMIPPSNVLLDGKLQEKEQQIQAQVNQIPHKDVTLQGQNVAMFSGGPPHQKTKVYVGLLHNGVPVGVDISDSQPSDDMDHKPLLMVKNWHSGAGDIEEVDCHSETSAIDLLATPGGIEMLEHLDSVVGSFQSLSSYTLAAQVLPPKPSLLVRHAAKEELAQINKTTPVLSGTLTAIVGGVSGALVSAAVVMAMLRPSRDLRREPLISDDA